jgi:hypothetical protein
MPLPCRLNDDEETYDEPHSMTISGITARSWRAAHIGQKYGEFRIPGPP